jgi:hypothetical protein
MTNRVGEPFDYPHTDDDGYIVDQGRVRGAGQTVANIAARNGIKAAVRVLGMEVKVLDADGAGNTKTYELKGGLANSDWTEVVVQAGGESNLRDLKDVNLPPFSQIGAIQPNRLISRAKTGVSGTPAADDIEYVPTPDLQTLRYPVLKMFYSNRGYGAANLQYIRAEAGIEILPTAGNASLIYINRTAIGDPGLSQNQASTNTPMLARSSLIIRAKKKKLQSGAHPSHQRYRVTIHGIGSATGTAHSVQVTMDFLSLLDDPFAFNDHAISIPTGLSSLHRIEIQRITGDTISAASGGLIIQTVAVESDVFLMDGFSERQRKFLKTLPDTPTVAHPVDGIVQSTDSPYDTQNFDGFKFFVLKANFGKLTGLTASDIVELNEGGIVIADETNRRWQVLFGSDNLSNALIAVNGTNQIWHYRGGTDLRVIAPRKITGLEDMDLPTVGDPDNFAVLKHYKDPAGAGKFWVAMSSPFDIYNRNTTSFQQAGRVTKMVEVTAGTQSGAGVPSQQGASYQIDVRKDTKVKTYFDLEKRDVLGYNDYWPLTVAVQMRSHSGVTHPIKYNVKVTGKNAAGSVITEDIVIEGEIIQKPRWFSVQLPVAMKTFTSLEWSDASTGAADADVSRYGALVTTGIFNPRIVEDLPGVSPVDPGEY